MSEREENDFYATHPKAIAPLLQILNLPQNSIIWENSCGEGHLAKEMIKLGHHVIATDLIDRGYGVGNINFLTDTWLHLMKYDAVIMNPPFKHAQEFIEKSLQICPTVCAFLRLAFLESDIRKEFFEKHPPETVAVFRDRVPYAKNAKFENYKSHPTCFAWFIWRDNNQNPPQIRWI